MESLVLDIQRSVNVNSPAVAPALQLPGLPLPRPHCAPLGAPPPQQNGWGSSPWSLSTATCLAALDCCPLWTSKFTKEKGPFARTPRLPGGMEFGGAGEGSLGRTESIPGRGLLSRGPEFCRQPLLSTHRPWGELPGPWRQWGLVAWGTCL